MARTNRNAVEGARMSGRVPGIKLYQFVREFEDKGEIRDGQ